jgi:peptide/nickel transport system permease protein
MQVSPPVEQRPSLAARTETPQEQQWGGLGRQLRRAKRSPGFVFGLIVIFGVVFAAVTAPLIAPHYYNAQNLSLRLKPAAWMSGGSWSYVLGTDPFGRDILSRIIYGARTSLLVGIAATVGEAILGTTLGLMAGFLTRRVDTIIMRIADVQLSFPYIVLGIAIIAVFGPSLSMVVFVLAISGWVSYARVVRVAVKGLRAQDFVTAAIAVGADPGRIIRRHLFPNVLPSVLVLSSFAVASNILGEATLSFLGLGVQPPTPTWGGMLSQAREYIFQAWWLMAWPGLALMITVLGINQLGDGLRDILDPHLRGRL